MITVTVTAQIGSGGRELALTLAEALGLTVVDRQIVKDAAQALGLPPDEVARAERPPSRWDRFWCVLAVQPVSSEWGPVLQAGLPLLPEELYRLALHQEIEQWAGWGRCLILDHGAAEVLGRRPRTFHLLCHAPREDRVERVCRDEWLSPREAARRVDAEDRLLSGWRRAAYGIDPFDPQHYDMSMDLSRLSFDAALRLAVQAITDREESARLRIVDRGLRQRHSAGRTGA